MNFFERILEVVNDPEGFQVPYKIYGQIDLEVLTEKYNRLTNNSKHPLVQRYKQR
jgi:hypothetical protein